MMVLKHESIPIQNENDVVLVRQAVRKIATTVRLSTIEQTKLITAASELARNTLIHGKGGEARLEQIEKESRPGVRITFEDQGPGIANMEKAMTDGFTTAGGLGLGLSGSKRLVNEFEIHSEVGKGTRVQVTFWKAGRL
jgi:serine/threonine-protein kinase RsbT